MTDAQPTEALQEVVWRVDPDARLLRARPLAGGVSAEVTALDIVRTAGQKTTLVLRRHGDADRDRNPRIARDEFALLGLVRAHGLPAPEPLAVDETGDLLPTPYLVVSYVDGAPDLAPVDASGHAAKAARWLVRIHEVGDGPGLAFLPRLDQRAGERPARPDVSLDEGRIRDALDVAGPPTRPNPPVLLHGDYWPGNLLWKDGDLVAILDWEDARVGDPLQDLGNSRLEFLWAFGVDAMEELTDRYRAATAVDATDLPLWDLRAALRPCGKLSDWGLDEATDRRMRDAHRRFVARAIDGLPTRPTGFARREPKDLS